MVTTRLRLGGGDFIVVLGWRRRLPLFSFPSFGRRWWAIGSDECRAVFDQVAPRPLLSCVLEPLFDEGFHWPGIFVRALAELRLTLQHL
jgi:hypothetical protein